MPGQAARPGVVYTCSAVPTPAGWPLLRARKTLLCNRLRSDRVGPVQDQKMNHSPAGWKRLALRLFAWTLLLWAIGGLTLTPVGAQEHGELVLEPAVAAPSFFWQV